LWLRIYVLQFGSYQQTTRLFGAKSEAILLTPFRLFLGPGAVAPPPAPTTAVRTAGGVVELRRVSRSARLPVRPGASPSRGPPMAHCVESLLRVAAWQ